MKNSFQLSLHDPLTQKIINTGQHDAYPGKRCIAMQVISSTREPQVVFSALEDEQYKAPVFKAALVSIRAISLTATACPVLLTFFWGWVLGLEFNGLFLGLSVTGVVFLQIATNLLNDIEDYRRLIDLAGGHGGSGVLQKGWLTIRHFYGLAVFSFAVTFLCALPIFLAEPLLALGIGVIGIVAAASYSSGPFSLKYRALGDVAVFFLCGPLLTAGASIAIFSEVPQWALGIGGFFGFLACGILHANNLQDIDIDRQRGATTLAGIAGFGASRWILIMFYVLAWLCLGATLSFTDLYHHVSLWALPVFLIAIVPTILLNLKAMKASGTASPTLNLIRIQAAQTHLVSCISLAAFLGLGYFLN